MIETALSYMDAFVHGLRAMQFELAIMLVVAVTAVTVAGIIGLALWVGGVFDPPKHFQPPRLNTASGRQIEKERA